MVLDTTELTIYEVEKLKDVFLEALKKEDSFTFDMVKIEKIDMVGIQLLLSLVKSANAMGKKMKFINTAQSVLHQIKVCHCDKALGMADD